MADIRHVYSQIVMQHAYKSDYHKEMDDPTKSVLGHNPSCGDEITLHLKLNGKVIEEASFTGHGCAISQASTSLMCQLIEGETIDQARKQVGDFIGMIKGTKTDMDELEDSIGDAIALQDISHMPQRVKCAELAWRTLGDLIDEEKGFNQGKSQPGQSLKERRPK